MSSQPQRPRAGLLSVRYGIPAALVLAGVICLFVASASSRWEAFALFTGSGLSVLLLNVLYRIGVKGDEERSHEDAAREHFKVKGEWPEDEGERPRGRRWTLPEGIATPEDEAAEAEATRGGDAELGRATPRDGE